MPKSTALNPQRSSASPLDNISKSHSKTFLNLFSLFKKTSRLSLSPIKTMMKSLHHHSRLKIQCVGLFFSKNTFLLFLPFRWNEVSESLKYFRFGLVISLSYSMFTHDHLSNSLSIRKGSRGIRRRTQSLAVCDDIFQWAIRLMSNEKSG